MAREYNHQIRWLVIIYGTHEDISTLKGMTFFPNTRMVLMSLGIDIEPNTFDHYSTKA